MSKQGRFIAVGIGMLLGAHISPRCRSEIEHADRVFGLVSDPVTERWLQSMRPDFLSLQPFYAEGKRRTESYREMIDSMLAQVRKGHSVCGVFYGHPGVFAQVAHETVAQALAEGYAAEMQPGISAEDCLYADLGIDPGRFGCQHFETSQFMFYRRQIDPAAHLVLWQIGVAGDLGVSVRITGPEYRQLLVDLLVEFGYPPEHQVILYEAATLPISRPRIDSVSMASLPGVDVGLHTTLVIPPARTMVKNASMLARLQRLRAGE